MEKSEIKALLALNGKCSYNEANKAAFRRLAVKLLRELAKRLALPPGACEIGYNPAGIACSGDASLHSDTLYVTFNADGTCPGIMGRTCKGRKDHVGGRNQWFSFEALAFRGVEGLAEWAKGVNPSEDEGDGTEGQDRKNYSDNQDRENYVPDGHLA